MTLLRLTSKDSFTLRDACMGVHVFGNIGSGKTTGSGAPLAGAFLRSGFGGLVLSAKSDEVALWQLYCRISGRLNSLVTLGERSGHFNFIDYELARQGADGLGSVIECLMRVLEGARLSNPNAGKASEAVWEESTRQVLRNILPVLWAATGTVTIPDIIQFVASAPRSPEKFQDAQWQESSMMARALLAARKNPLKPIDQGELRSIYLYWRDEFATLDNKLRSSITMTLSTTLDRFTRGRLKRVFCSDTTVVPEMAFHGAIILMNMPALTWNEDGIIAQQLFKFMFQRAVLSRNSLAPQHRERPVFLWADEAQYFVNSFDAEYQSTCRASRACSVYLTQSLPGYYAKMGGEQAKHKADMLLGNFVTKIFHNNADPQTNQWAADTIGKGIERRANYSEGVSDGYSRGVNLGENTSWGTSSGWGSSSDGKGNRSSNFNNGSNSGGGESRGLNRGSNGGRSQSIGYSEAMDYEIQPGDFSRYLKTGGPANDNEVTALWFQAGRTFRESGRNYLYARFKQAS
jgi:uncharacterized membrane protein YgcG